VREQTHAGRGMRALQSRAWPAFACGQGCPASAHGELEAYRSIGQKSLPMGRHAFCTYAQRILLDMGTDRDRIFRPMAGDLFFDPSCLAGLAFKNASGRLAMSEDTCVPHVQAGPRGRSVTIAL
jgi:hypothetical protein